MMRARKVIYVIILFFSISVHAQYAIKSPHLQNPEKAIEFVDSCATFWLDTYDETLGGFFTYIGRYGNVTGTNKNMLTQTRNAYGFVRAYMLTGNTTYLLMARKALDFLYEHAWDITYGGWYRELDINGNPIDRHADKIAFDQHYALLGISAYYEATADSGDFQWLMNGYSYNENFFWDNRPSYLGYYDTADFNGSNGRDKSFNATVDAITTHILYLYLLTEDQSYKTRLKQLADQILNHLVASMDYQAIGFVEKFDSDWNWNDDEPMTIMGHCLKTTWCLARIYHIDPNNEYIPAAEKLVSDVLEKGYDQELGGPYKDYNRITGEMLMWDNPDILKTGWAMEQAMTSGLELYRITGETRYLKMADETLDFFMTYFVDYEYGEVYMDRTRTGDFAWNENKGNEWKAAYHSIEMGYYAYLYGKLFVKCEPVTLHYNFVQSNEDRNIILTPLAIEDSQLRIQQVLWEGQPYTNYDPNDRILKLPADVNGHFEVTYEPVISPDDYNNVTFNVVVPSSTPVSDIIYIAGTFNYWDPGPAQTGIDGLDHDLPLTAMRDNNWQITILFPPGENIEYKYTRGSWQTVEKGAQGEEISNRLLSVPAGHYIQSDTVANWADIPAPK
jgi:mannose/cellobiose epimerase-like protein (N-acyl-D-glucosamine 2-epimerase family)